MSYFEVNVRVGLQIVATRILAKNANDAKLLFVAQYGSNNLIGFIRKVS
jgi:hypothetical protein